MRAIDTDAHITALYIPAKLTGAWPISSSPRVCLSVSSARSPPSSRINALDATPIYFFQAFR
jgi:hypothetical protein